MSPPNVTASEIAPIVAPNSWAFDVNDALRLTSFNGAAGVTLVMEGRTMTPNGNIVPFSRPHTPNTDRTAASTTVTMGAGYLLNLQVRATAGTPRRGQCFVLVEVVRGSGSAVESLGALIQDYATTTSRLSWPGSAILASSAPPGALRSITGTDPAANAEISETVPTNARWRLLALMATLVSDGTVANRDAALTIDDGTTVVGRFPAGQNQAASLTTRYVWAAAGSRFTIAGDRTIVVPIPDLWYPDGYRFKTVTFNLQATDNWGPPQLFIEELIED